MMDADVEVRCNAGDGEVSPDRVNSRNGYRRRSGIPGRGPSSWRSRSCGPGRTSRRSWSTAAGPSRRWPRSWRPVTCWASRPGGWRSSQPPRRGGPVQVAVSAIAAELDELVEGFRNRPLDAGPYTCLQGFVPTEPPDRVSVRRLAASFARSAKPFHGSATMQPCSYLLSKRYSYCREEPASVQLARPIPVLIGSAPTTGCLAASHLCKRGRMGKTASQPASQRARQDSNPRPAA